MSYYLEDHPNPNFAQYGWPRTKISGVIGVHTTESGVVPAGADPGAENTAGFIGRRTDPGSYHILADWDTIVPLTRPTFAAWADVTNNVHALSVSGAMNAARWRDLTPERAAGIVRNMGIAAAILVRDAIAHGVLAEIVPARRITAAEAIAGTRAGFYGHGETNPGTRYDPGTNFDWDLFLSTYAAAVGGGIQLQSMSVSEEDDDLTPDQFNQLVGKLDELNAAHHVATREHINGKVPDIAKAAAQATMSYPVRYRDPLTGAETDQTTTLSTVVAFNDFNEVQTRIEATSSPREIANLVPETFVEEVARLLTERLAK